MLWRVAPVALLSVVATNPVALAAVAGYVYLRKTDGAVRQEPNQPRADFIGGVNGVECCIPGRASIFAAVSPTLTAAAAIMTAGSAIADATTEAASAVGNATREATTWVGDTVSSAASRIKRQLTNEGASERLRADAALRIAMLEEMAKLSSTTAFFKRMRAMFAVGVAIAAADGEISVAEQEHIQEYIGGAAHADLPADLIGALQGWLACPPSLEEAFEAALQCGIENMHFFDNVIDVAIRADEDVHPAEIEFKARWHELLEAARA